MTNLSANLKKILHISHPGGKKNPYSSPHHPNHNPISAPSGSASTFKARPRPTALPASPRGSFDFLAEAREAVGRDRVTGRRVVHVEQRERAVEDDGTEERERSAFVTTNLNARPRSGTRYDLFVQEMKDRREGGARDPVEGYYAPAPKQATEYYAPEAPVAPMQRR